MPATTAPLCTSSPPPSVAMWLWLLVLAAVVGALLAWVTFLEAPRLAGLLREIKAQQHARVLGGEGKGDDAARAAAHAESLQFDVQPLTLTVTYTDIDGVTRTDT